MLFKHSANRAGILQKMKEGAENVEKKLQAKVESMKNANDGKGEYNIIFMFWTLQHISK